MLCLTVENVEPDPDVVPLQYLGSAESELSAASTQDLLMHALANMSDEGGYAIRHGSHFVSTFPGGEGYKSEENFLT